MIDSGTLLTALKRILKGRGVTYRHVAQALGLSEASVKRLFSRQDFTLERLERVCTLVELSLGDLVRLAEAGQPDITELSDAQETELVANRKLLLVAVLVVNGWKFEEILADFALSEQEVIQYLARLDRLKLIDLLPKNRIALRISRNFTWRRGGAIEQFFEKQVKSEFVNSRFDAPNELMRFAFGVLSNRSVAIMQRRLEQAVRELNELHQEDARLPFDERHGTSMLVAIRRWELSVFGDLRRAKAQRG